MNNKTDICQCKDEGQTGSIFIISAPSGAGKTTLCKMILKQFPNIYYSVSFTTRPIRTGENEGKDYYFVSKEEFLKGVEEDKWAEWAQVHGNYYGTSADFLKEELSKGNDVLLDIDVKGTIQVLKKFPESITIFIMPPSLDILRKRLESRGTDSPEIINKRIKNAEEEISKKYIYKYIIINDHLSTAFEELANIFGKHNVVRSSWFMADSS